MKPGGLSKKGGFPAGPGRAGFATLVVIVVVALLLALLLANARLLALTKAELKRVEERQLQRRPAESGTAAGPPVGGRR